MAILRIPDEGVELKEPAAIRERLAGWGVWFDQWEAAEEFAADADQETVLRAYAHVLQPFMESRGYKTADVICLSESTPNLPALRAKFIKEHTHTEDEVRFFVEGEGEFWFNLGNGVPVFCVVCQRGDLISVPAHHAHWFDAGDRPFVKAIRIFIDQSGWVPHYTGAGTAARYKPEVAEIAS